MTSQTMLIIFAVVVVIAVIVIAVFAASTRRTTGKSAPPAAPRVESQTSTQAPVAEAPVAAPQVEPGEQIASPAAEEIEGLVRPKLAKYSDLRRVKLDFGTAADGSLQVQLGPSHYNSIDDIPDQRLRQAIQEAVQEWNEKKGG